MKRLFFAVVAILFAACTTDVTKDVAVEVPQTLTVSFEEDTRIQLMNGKTVWNEGDLVSVFYRSDANQQWKFNGQTGATTAELTKVVEPEATNTLSKVVTIYPYNENYTIDAECKVTATLPAEQEYLADSFGVGSSIMVAESESNNAQLRNAMGWLRLHLTGDGEVVKSITVKGNNSEQVAGQITINPSDASITLAESSTATTVTLNCTEGVTLSSEATAFYIALPPQKFEGGITAEINCNDGSKMVKSTSNSVTIKRNTILPMEELSYQENTRIYYTATEKIVPYKTDVFGANIVSNEWDETTGKGIITFDAPVTEIGYYAFYDCSSLTSVTIPDSVTEIGNSAFSYCSSLTNVTIPDSVTEIGRRAFEDCSSLTSVTIPNSVTKIENSAFYDCSSLKDVYYTGDISAWCKISFENFTAHPLYYGAKLYIDNKEVTEVAIPSDVAEIKDYAFSGCSNLTSVTIGNSVTTIGEGAFRGCTSLASITIPDSVTSIGNSAFSGCTSLASITIPDSVTSIGSYAFEGCTSLTSITIPYSVTEIGSSAFYDCSNLTSVTIGNSVTTIGSYAFYKCSSITSVTIGNSVTSIGSDAFYKCSSLKDVYYTGDISAWCKISFERGDANPLYYGAKLYIDNKEVTEVTIPSDITEIKNYTFCGCTSLASVTISDSVTSIGEYTFSNCSNLTSVTIGNRVTEIKYSAFDGCSSLTSITIPDSVTKIGSYAFRNCSSLTSVTIGNRVTTIGSSAFYNCSNLTSVTIGNSVTSIGESAFDGCSSLTSVTIGNSVTTIGYRAFSGCSSLKDVYYTGDISAWCKISFKSGDANPLSYGAKLYIDNKEVTEVTIPSDVAKIKGYAFYYCSSLTSVTIPNSVTEIGDYAFFCCSSLTSVTIGNSVTEIGRRAFCDCSSLTSVTIPDSVTSIGDFAFDGCSSLTSVTIGNRVTEIKYSAFYGCTSLKEVYCKSTIPPSAYFDTYYSTWNTFDNNASDRKIYVPASDDDSVINAYKAAAGWSDYAADIEEYDFTE